MYISYPQLHIGLTSPDHDPNLKGIILELKQSVLIQFTYLFLALIFCQWNKDSIILQLPYLFLALIFVSGIGSQKKMQLTYLFLALICCQWNQEYRNIAKYRINNYFAQKTRGNHFVAKSRTLAGNLGPLNLRSQEV